LVRQGSEIEVAGIRTRAVYGQPSTGKSNLLALLVACKVIAIDTDEVISFLDPEYWGKDRDSVDPEFYETVAEVAAQLVIRHNGILLTNMQDASLRQIWTKHGILPDHKFKVGFFRKEGSELVANVQDRTNQTREYMEERAQAWVDEDKEERAFVENAITLGRDEFITDFVKVETSEPSYWKIKFGDIVLVHRVQLRQDAIHSWTILSKDDFANGKSKLDRACVYPFGGWLNSSGLREKWEEFDVPSNLKASLERFSDLVSTRYPFFLEESGDTKTEVEQSTTEEKPAPEEPEVERQEEPDETDQPKADGGDVTTTPKSTAYLRSFLE
jgi:hypothetical protein